MPLSMKIQPIDASTPDGGSTRSEPTKPVVKSRLKRLFRISVSEPPLHLTKDGLGEFEPSSVCLAKMVQNFIEDSSEKQSTKCGRNGCNCFNGNGSDSSERESEKISSADACDFLKTLVVCASVNERNVLADTAKIVERNKACKRKDDFRKILMDSLIGFGYNASICKSKWDKTSSFPAGEYEYVDVIVEGERLIIDTDFRSEFEIARSTKTYRSILQFLPYIFVGKSDRLSRIIALVSEAAKQSLKKKDMHLPPWRRSEYVQAKWLSPHTRLTPTPPSPLTASEPANSGDLSPDKESLIFQLDEFSLSRSSPRSESLFLMSDSSGEEEATSSGKLPVEIDPNGSKIGVKFGTGLASLMEDEP
ncbi:hypothetical protein Nepgr_004222 [Nepenthes gracilis]|uniref:Uncharacterized protein n=1 Tax=Nepenthes gracilis TaxID=150966 RepID=A0AAD3XEU8_NEPGR|nr:hypothetical protein Nepgr_004222 [Nepenthes gracilis]